MNTAFLLFALHLPERRMFNEYYARDTSRKIRSTFQSKGKSGKHLTGTVIYGYLWNEARDQWLVDPEAAEVVKRIFDQKLLSSLPYCCIINLLVIFAAKITNKQKHYCFEKSDYTCIDWHYFRRSIGRCDLFPLLLFSYGIWTHYRTFSMGVLRIGQTL